MEKHKCYSEEFVRSSDNSLFVWEVIPSFCKVIVSKGLRMGNGTYGDIPDNSSDVRVSSFRDFGFSSEFAGLFDGWVKPCECDKLFMGWESIYVLDFSEQKGGTQFSYSLDGCKGLKLLGTKKFYFIDELVCDNSNFFFKVEEPSDETLKDYFPVWVIDTDCIVDDFRDGVCGDGWLSAFSGEDFIYYLLDAFYSHFSCNSCGWDFEEELKHALC